MCVKLLLTVVLNILEENPNNWDECVGFSLEWIKETLLLSSCQL